MTDFESADDLAAWRRHPDHDPGIDLEILQDDDATTTVARLTIRHPDGSTTATTGSSRRHPDDLPDPSIGTNLALARALNSASLLIGNAAGSAIRAADIAARDRRLAEVRAYHRAVYDLLEDIDDAIEDLREVRAAARLADNALLDAMDPPLDDETELLRFGPNLAATDAAWHTAHRHRQIIIAKLTRADTDLAETRADIDRADHAFAASILRGPSHNHPGDYDPTCQACDDTIEEL